MLFSVKYFFWSKKCIKLVFVFAFFCKSIFINFNQHTFLSILVVVLVDMENRSDHSLLDQQYELGAERILLSNNYPHSRGLLWICFHELFVLASKRDNLVSTSSFSTTILLIQKLFPVRWHYPFTNFIASSKHYLVLSVPNSYCWWENLLFEYIILSAVIIIMGLVIQ